MIFTCVHVLLSTFLMTNVANFPELLCFVHRFLCLYAKIYILIGFCFRFGYEIRESRYQNGHDHTKNKNYSLFESGGFKEYFLNFGFGHIFLITFYFLRK